MLNKNKKKSNIIKSRKTKKVAAYQVQDFYFKKAKKEWYRARSVYKLIEIQERFSIIKEWMNICDLWSAPWSFIQYIKKIIKDTGKILWIDLKEINKYSQNNIHTIVHNIFEFDSLKPKVEEFIWEWQLFDLITSDIAPNTSWIRDIDQYESVNLNISILKFSDYFLKKWWNLLLKVFKWEDIGDLIKQINKRFISFTEYKPLACRDRSFEIYFICFNKKD